MESRYPTHPITFKMGLTVIFGGKIYEHPGSLMFLSFHRHRSMI